MLVWLGLRFDTVNIMVSITDEKLVEVSTLVENWTLKKVANIHELQTILDKLFYMAQCCPPARFFINRMLDALRSCPAQAFVHLSHDFTKDLT